MAALLKDLYNEKFIYQLSKYIKSHYILFPSEDFYSSIFDDSWESLELKQRMRHISTNMYKKVLQII